MSVSLLCYHDEYIPVVCARYMNKDDYSWDRVLKILSRHEDSVLEFSLVIFDLETSLVVRDHLVRYRTASMAVGGLRYNEPDGFVVPPEITDEQARTLIMGFYNEAMAFYDSLRDEGLKKQAARYIVPCGVKTRYFFGCNIRTLAKNLLPDRMAKGAQPETRDVAIAMFREVYKKNPRLWEAIKDAYFPWAQDLLPVQEDASIERLPEKL